MFEQCKFKSNEEVDHTTFNQFHLLSLTNMILLQYYMKDPIRIVQGFLYTLSLQYVYVRLLIDHDNNRCP